MLEVSLLLAATRQERSRPARCSRCLTAVPGSTRWRRVQRWSWRQGRCSLPQTRSES